MVYNFNLGIGWASSGVEYAQSYRAGIFRRAKIPAKFIFTDMFPTENISHMTKNIGFEDSEVIWLYTFFTDTKISPVTYTLRQFENTIDRVDFIKKKEGNVVKYIFPGNGNFYTCFLVDNKTDRVHRVEYVSDGFLVRKDYFTYCRIYTEYYAPLDNKAHMYHRRFFNEDGSVAYEEINDDDKPIFRFPNKILYSKEELVGYMVSKLPLTKNDVVLIDRTTGVGQSILENVRDARVGMMIHADHFSEGSTDEINILWNNYYEYSFSQSKHIDFYITATDAQNKLMRQQFEKYMGTHPEIITIPVGSLDELKHPHDGTNHDKRAYYGMPSDRMSYDARTYDRMISDKMTSDKIFSDKLISNRRAHSLITASRLADEKHIDWIVEAVVRAKYDIPDITLDIYGKGANENSLKELIAKNNAEKYIRLMGQHDLTDIYVKYDAYISGSMSEGFGLTLMEAVGSGLPIIGFDVRYGNPTFIEDGRNGYLIPVNDDMDANSKTEELRKAIVRLFTQDDMKLCHRTSYKKAEEFLTYRVMKKWKALIEKN